MTDEARADVQRLLRAGVRKIEIHRSGLASRPTIDRIAREMTRAGERLPKMGEKPPLAPAPVDAPAAPTAHPDAPAAAPTEAAPAAVDADARAALREIASIAGRALAGDAPPPAAPNEEAHG